MSITSLFSRRAAPVPMMERSIPERVAEVMRAYQVPYIDGERAVRSGTFPPLPVIARGRVLAALIMEQTMLDPDIPSHMQRFMQIQAVVTTSVMAYNNVYIEAHTPTPQPIAPPVPIPMPPEVPIGDPPPEPTPTLHRGRLSGL